jgi:hypothetical protein
MKVKVIKPVQVVHDGKKYTLGDTTPDVPDDVEQGWVRQGWATEIKHTPPRKKPG